MVLKTEGNTYATLAASPSPLRGKPTLAQDIASRISGAVAGEVFAQVKTYQVPITNPSPSHLHYLPLVFLSPTSPLSFYSPSLFSVRLFFARFLFARVLDCLLVVMASPLSTPLSPENEVLNFKQREGENLKYAWYRICNAQNRSTRKKSNSILL